MESNKFKTHLKSQIKMELENNEEAIIKGLDIIDNNISEQEKVLGYSVNNGLGFSKFDKALGHSLAVVARQNGFLSKSQMNSARSIMKKYSGQLADKIMSGVSLPGMGKRVESQGSLFGDVQ